tara:strand:- start:81425 stop:82180 length:756 start_codon:yes stop_codon:yes gene_type:complete
LNNIDIYNEDCEHTLNNRIEDNSLDLVICSPPYNVDLGNNKLNKNPYDLYNDNKEHQDYIKWLRSIFEKIYLKTKLGGRCIINIGDGKNGAVPTHSDIIQFMKELNWIPMSTIIWNKNQVGNRTAWGSFKSPSSPSFPTPFEYVLVFGKGNKKLQWKGETDIEKQEFIDWAYGIWNFAPETRMKKIGHPAMFPIELPKRCLKMFSWVDSLVYDPFSGAGTTAIACKEFNRNFIGSELSKDYYDLSLERINI